jgi:hypothetical protein
MSENTALLPPARLNAPVSLSESANDLLQLRIYSAESGPREQS